MNSYIALALVLCIAVAQVQSQGAQPTTGGASTARSSAASAGFLGRSMLPLMAAGSGNDMMQNLFLFRMLSQGRRAGGAMGGLEPLLMSNLLGLELFGM